jgi:hypothetical protein
MNEYIKKITDLLKDVCYIDFEHIKVSENIISPYHYLITFNDNIKNKRIRVEFEDKYYNYIDFIKAINNKISGDYEEYKALVVYSTGFTKEKNNIVCSLSDKVIKVLQEVERNELNKVIPESNKTIKRTKI